MKVVKAKNKEELGVKAADIIEETLRSVENPVIGLATGSTPEKLYEILVERCKTGRISFQHATTFNLDEYVGLSNNNEGSYRYYMDQKLFNGIDIPKERAYVPNGMAPDLELESKTYEKQISEAGKIDVQILGIGLNGHIGFNEPGTEIDSRTHVVGLSESTIQVNARFFPSIEEVPTEAITMGIATIMEAKKIVLLVQGEKKAEILKKVLEGEVTKEVPASILQNHPDVTVITDIEV